MTMQREVTIALMGVGGYGGAYVAELLDAPRDRGVRIVAAIDPAAERCPRLAELQARGGAVFADAERFYETATADLAVISAPIHLHAPLTRLALEKGSNVLCEKPLCATVQEALYLLDAERQSGRFAAIGYQWSFSDTVQALKKDILAGRLGKPRRIKTLCSWPRRASYYGRSRWAGALRTDSGAWVLDSPANNATAHYLHNMFYLLGGSRETAALPSDVQAELYRANAIQSFDTAAIRCHTDQGVEVLFYTTHAVPSMIGPVVCCEFDEAVVHFASEAGNRFVARFRNGEVKDYGIPDAGTGGKLWQVVEAVRSGALPACGIRAAMAQTICINGAHDSVPAIAVFPDDVVRRETDARGDCLTWVAGLQAALVQAYDRWALPSEIGDVAWARAGARVLLKDYHSFPRIDD